MEGGIKKIIKEIDENGNEIEIEVTEYPDIPVIVVNSDEEDIIPEESFIENNSEVQSDLIENDESGESEENNEELLNNIDLENIEAE